MHFVSRILNFLLFGNTNWQETAALTETWLIIWVF